MPDIDVDFCYERRQEVIDYVARRYGADHVSQIITFGTMAARAVVRDVGRAMGYPYAEVDEVAKLIPMELGMTLEKALKANPELRRRYEDEPRVSALIDTLAHAGGHAAPRLHPCGGRADHQAARHGLRAAAAQRRGHHHPNSPWAPLRSSVCSRWTSWACARSLSFAMRWT